MNSLRNKHGARQKGEVDDVLLEPMKLDDIYKAPGHLIRRLHQISTAIFLDEFKGHSINASQYAALIAIRDRPGIDQKTLVDLIAVDRSTAGSMLRILEERKFLSRVTPKFNQRVKILTILPAGERFLDQTRTAIHRVQERILKPLRQSERKSYMSLLTKLVELNNGHSRAPFRPREFSRVTKGDHEKD